MELIGISRNNVFKPFSGLKAVVFGGAGFIGSHLTERLVSLNAEVTVVDNLATSSIDNLSSIMDSIEFIRGDIQNSHVFDELEPADVVFNEAAVSLTQSFFNPSLDLDINAGGTINILDYARKHNARFVHASSGSVYGEPQYVPMDERHPLNPISFYAVSKMAAESYCRLYHALYGVRVSVLRYFNVYGIRQRIGEETGVIPIFVSRVLKNQPLSIFGDGLQTRDFLHVDDCVNATLLAALSPKSIGCVANVGGIGDEVSIMSWSGGKNET